MKEFYFVLVVPIIATIYAATIPNYIHVCHRSNPNLSECILHSIEELRPKLRDGIPELDVPSLEPLRINDIVVRGFADFSINLNLMNVDVFGCSVFTIEKLEMDVSNFNYRIGLVYPLLNFQGNFIVDTTMLAIPIKASGIFEANATNCKGEALLVGDIIQGRHGKELHFTDLHIKFTISDYVVKMRNFMNNAEMSDIINDLVNSDRVELFNTMTPLIQQKASETLLHLANHVVRNFAYDDVLPE